MKKYLLNTLTISLCLLVFFLSVDAQYDEGVSRFQKGEYKNAVKKFQNVVKTDSANPNAWNYLGLALEKTGEYKEAQFALEKAIALQPENPSFRANLAFVFLRRKKYTDARRTADTAIELDKNNANAFYIRSAALYAKEEIEEALVDSRQSITLNEKFAAAYILEADILMARFGKSWSDDSSEKTLAILGESIASLEKCLKVCGPDPVVEARLEDHRAFYHYFEKKLDDDTDAISSKSSDGSSFKVKSMPFPVYTEAAKGKLVQGTVRLAVMFRENGTIGPVVVLEGLPAGLTEQAVIAAQKIKFKPEVRDGNPVTVVRMVRFDFFQQ